MLVLPLVLFPLLAVAISFPGHEYFSSAGSSLGLIDDEPPAAGTRQDHSVVSTGTTMVAAKYRDGVIVGADSRSVKSKSLWNELPSSPVTLLFTAFPPTPYPPLFSQMVVTCSTGLQTRCYK